MTGFLSQAGVVKLGDLTIPSAMEYGTVHVISLDAEPLATSRKILIQAFSEERMYGFRAENGVIQDAGRLPINVRDIQATVTFIQGSSLKATPLDPNGYASGSATPVKAGAVTLPKNSLYTIITR